MNFYDEMLDDMNEISTDDEFNQGPFIYRSETPGANPWDAVTYTDISVPGGFVGGVSQRYVTDLVTTSDLHAILPVFGVTPTNAGRLVIDGIERQIISVMPSPAAGTVVCWHVFVKG